MFAGGAVSLGAQKGTHTHKRHKLTHARADVHFACCRSFKPLICVSVSVTLASAYCGRKPWWNLGLFVVCHTDVELTRTGYGNRTWCRQRQVKRFTEVGLEKTGRISERSRFQCTGKPHAGEKIVRCCYVAVSVVPSITRHCDCKAVDWLGPGGFGWFMRKFFFMVAACSELDRPRVNDHSHTRKDLVRRLRKTEDEIVLSMSCSFNDADPIVAALIFDQRHQCFAQGVSILPKLHRIVFLLRTR